MTGMLGAVCCLLALEAAEPPAAVRVVIPNYVVAEVGGIDFATIPGGRVLASEEGRPEIPYYVQSVSIPEGYRVQEVTLARRSGLKTDSGLVLPVVQPDEGEAVPVKPGFYPANEFEWRATYGTEPRLAIAVYPFRYDSKKTKVEFYQEYEFAVRCAKTAVGITDLKPDKPVFDLKEEVGVWVLLENRDEVQEVKVQGSVRRPFQDKPVAELTPVGLKLGPSDSVRLKWTPAKTETGDHELQVVVRDEADNELDRAQALFRLGNPQGEVTSFSARPEHFRIGDDIELALEFKNTGTCDLAGECVFRIMKAGETVEELTQPMLALRPGGSKSFRQTWGTEKADKAVLYHAVGFVRFAGTSSEARSATFSTNKMPTAEFTFAPDTALVGEEVRFDATGSADEDGKVVEFGWEFDDGATASDSLAKHVYQQPGVYEVRLKVTDNGGRTGEIKKLVPVVEP